MSFERRGLEKGKKKWTNDGLLGLLKIQTGRNGSVGASDEQVLYRNVRYRPCEPSTSSPSTCTPSRLYRRELARTGGGRRRKDELISIRSNPGRSKVDPQESSDYRASPILSSCRPGCTSWEGRGERKEVSSRLKEAHTPSSSSSSSWVAAPTP